MSGNNTNNAVEDRRSTATISADTALGRLREENVEHAEVVGAEYDADRDCVVIAYDEPVGVCPGCGGRAVGTTAWNSAQGRSFACPDDGCGVETHTNEVWTP